MQQFADGWVRQLNARGYLGGMYSSLCSGILDMQASVNTSDRVPLNAVWVAAWNNTPTVYGFGAPLRRCPTRCGTTTSASTSTAAATTRPTAA